ncbi:MAG: class I SAM-dependent methyltransferase [Firmicutes bacterium]|nr:class I SAM-dependent methyltransferase [Bacillota bacterium]
MDKQEIISFFNRYAPQWDADQVDKTPIIRRILDNAGIGEGIDILDVACGTGVMFPYYLERKVARITGIDISPEMAKRAAEKFSDASNVQVICGDVEETAFYRQFDAVVVYNAFPHFPDPKHLIQVLASVTKPGGTITVAHGASREAIDAHHSGSAKSVSHGLMAAQDLKTLLEPLYTVDVVISNAEMYQVTGVRKTSY